MGVWQECLASVDYARLLTLDIRKTGGYVSVQFACCITCAGFLEKGSCGRSIAFEMRIHIRSNLRVGEDAAFENGFNY